MMIYVYARVSTKEQNLGRQMVDLEKYVGTNFIFTDKQSGKDMDRKEYQLLRYNYYQKQSTKLILI